jgi:broad specificity phosphatase PhoE
LQPIQIALVRHGRASAGWDTALDPELDDLGHSQAQEVANKLDQIFVGKDVEIISSPLLRCRQTASVFAKLRVLPERVCAEVTEIPSPAGVEMSGRVDWLREVMKGRWSDLDKNYLAFRDGLVEFVRAIEHDTVIFSHFVAINAVIGALTNNDLLVIRSLDNCSVTLLECDAKGILRVSQAGHEANTLIR